MNFSCNVFSQDMFKSAFYNFFRNPCKDLFRHAFHIFVQCTQRSSNNIFLHFSEDSYSIDFLSDTNPQFHHCLPYVFFREFYQDHEMYKAHSKSMLINLSTVVQLLPITLLHSESQTEGHPLLAGYTSRAPQQGCQHSCGENYHDTQLDKQAPSSQLLNEHNATPSKGGRNRKSVIKLPTQKSAEPGRPSDSAGDHVLCNPVAHFRAHVCYLPTVIMFVA